MSSGDSGWAADRCPCVDKLRAVLPLSDVTRDSVVHLVSVLGSVVISARAELGSIIASALPVATMLICQRACICVGACVCVLVLQREETHSTRCVLVLALRLSPVSLALLLQGFPSLFNVWGACWWGQGGREHRVVRAAAGRRRQRRSVGRVVWRGVAADGVVGRLRCRLRYVLPRLRDT
jgi:hypothetical protein